jgi:PAS domain S-box-containing protein
MSIIYDALASADINQLLGEAVQIVAGTLWADHIVVLELGTIASQSCFCSSMGWDQPTSLRLGKQLLDQARQPETTDLEEIISSKDPRQGGIYRSSRTFLQEHGLCDGLFVIVPCGPGSLGLFAGDARGSGSLFGESDARSLHAIVTVLSLAVRRASTELAHIANLQQVVRAKHQWETTLDALPQLICLIDERGLVIRANRTLERWQLGEVRSIRGVHVHDMLHPGCTDSSCILNVQLERMLRQLNDTQFTECALRDLLPGSELHLSLFRGNSSHYEDRVAEQGYAFLVIENISQQKHQERLLEDYNKELEKKLHEQSAQLEVTNVRLEDEIWEHRLDKEILRESEKRYSCFVENTLTGIYAIKSNQLNFCNKRFAEIFGYGRDDIYQLGVHELFSSDKQWLVSGQMAMRANGMAEEHTVKGKTRAGETIWLRRSLSVIDCQSEPMILGSIVDVTAQKNAEDGLRCSERELSDLSEKLLLTQEAERKRIALELHDGIGQSLTAIKLSVETALQVRGEKTPQQNGCMKGVVDKLCDAIKEVRSISMGLRPSMLDDLGLVATIGWFCREFQAVYPSIRIKKRIELEGGEIPDGLQIVIFRILQEAFNNIGKHAGASTISVELERAGDTLKLLIEDDGRGIAPEAFRVGKGLGLGSMKERAKLSSGSFTVDSTHGTGTAIRVVWPLPF